MMTTQIALRGNCNASPSARLRSGFFAVQAGAATVARLISDADAACLTALNIGLGTAIDDQLHPAIEVARRHPTECTLADGFRAIEAVQRLVSRMDRRRHATADVDGTRWPAAVALTLAGLAQIEQGLETIPLLASYLPDRPIEIDDELEPPAASMQHERRVPMRARRRDRRVKPAIHTANRRRGEGPSAVDESQFAGRGEAV